MATSSKTPKSGKTAAAAKSKAVPVKAKTAAAAAKPAKAPMKKASPAKATAIKAAAPKPATRPAVKPAVKPVAKPVTPSLAQPAKTPLLTVKPKISAEQRRNYIEVAAYFIAERTGFSAVNALDHWTQAEAEIDRLLKEGKLNA